MEDAEEEHETAKEELTELKKRVLAILYVYMCTERLNSEYTAVQMKKIVYGTMERQLESVNGLNDEPSSNSSSPSSSSSVGSKHQKNKKNEKNEMMIHHRTMVVRGRKSILFRF